MEKSASERLSDLLTYVLPEHYTESDIKKLTQEMLTIATSTPREYKGLHTPLLVILLVLAVLLLGVS